MLLSKVFSGLAKHLNTSNNSAKIMASGWSGLAVLAFQFGGYTGIGLEATMVRAK